MALPAAGHRRSRAGSIGAGVAAVAASTLFAVTVLGPWVGGHGPAMPAGSVVASAKTTTRIPSSISPVTEAATAGGARVVLDGIGGGGSGSFPSAGRLSWWWSCPPGTASGFRLQVVPAGAARFGGQAPGSRTTGSGHAALVRSGTVLTQAGPSCRYHVEATE